MNHKDIFSLESYDYELPQDLIAQNPAQPADSCKFLVCEQSHSNIQFKDMIFKDIINLVQDSVFFFNDTKVIKSRIFLKNVLAISPD
ncbi:MAG: S-adenosylmethionine:tRNA ribosyltransferase-isomerase [Patescibacteria group bacterium]